MKKFYNQPEVETTVLSSMNIICASPEGISQGDDLGDGYVVGE